MSKNYSTVCVALWTYERQCMSATSAQPSTHSTNVSELRFNVFGSLIAIVGTAGARSAFVLGLDGKRQPANFIIPEFLAEDELCQYLADLFHEAATPSNGDVHQVE